MIDVRIIRKIHINNRSMNVDQVYYILLATHFFAFSKAFLYFTWLFVSKKFIKIRKTIACIFLIVHIYSPSKFIAQQGREHSLILEIIFSYKCVDVLMYINAGVKTTKKVMWKMFGSLYTLTYAIYKGIEVKRAKSFKSKI